MKKTIFTVFFFIISIFSFPVINDNLNLLKEEEKKLIDGKITELKDEENIEIFVNTLLIDEGFTVKDPEKTLILNIKKSENDENYQIETSWSKDINVEEHGEEIDGVLEGAKDFLEKKEYSNYILSVLDGFQVILKDIDVEVQANMEDIVEENSFQTQYRKYIFVFGIVIFVLAVAYSIKDKKRKKIKALKNKKEK